MTEREVSGFRYLLLAEKEPKETKKRTAAKMRTIVGKKAGYTGMILALYILGRGIPLPWVTYTPTAETGFQSFLLQMIGAQTRSGSLLSLGLMPWMTASIVSALFRAVMHADTARSSPAHARRMTALLGLVVALVQAYVTAARLNYRDGYFSSPLFRSAAKELNNTASIPKQNFPLFCIIIYPFLFKSSSLSPSLRHTSRYSSLVLKF